MTRQSNKHPTNHLRAWRTYRGLTQQELADAAGTTGCVISLLENGERKLTHGWLQQFAAVLKTTPGVILDFAPEEVDGDITRAAMNVPAERQTDAMALLEWMSRDSVQLAASENSRRSST
ncbi:MAG TPA: helix-turn-helix transcriptional regulator [Caulobacteraceae bacterium]|jgi:transcriptional regulator with XRE-family HTH domain